jgi:N-acetylglucosaminyl-diphospho-decaprenol L-rhamnosyltransferase
VTDASRLSIVVVSWRSAATLPALIASVERHLGTSPEIVVVENDPAERSGLTPDSYAGELQIVEPEDSRGYGAACNAGVAAASRPDVALLNPDCELADSGLPAVAAVAAERRALAGPRLLNVDGSVQPSASGPPAGAWPWVGALVPGGLQPAWMRARTEPWRLDREAEVGWLTGACLVAPRELLAELGPFDPAIQLYAEDMDLCLRAGRLGAPSIFRPDLCRVIHVGGASTRQAFGDEETARRIARNRRSVLLRAVGPRREANAWRALRLNLTLRCIAKRVVGADSRRDRQALAATRAAKTAAPLGSALEE